MSLFFFWQVSATFAASLIISPALGAYIGKIYDDSAVVALATFVAASDLLFILIAVPESLPERVRPASWGAPISWEQADPFAVSTIFLKLILIENMFNHSWCIAFI